MHAVNQMARWEIKLDHNYPRVIKHICHDNQWAGKYNIVLEKIYSKSK